jgi:diguanylate cyclase (GGDEF)-like protein/PAS domain S-box-containing protein
LVRDWRICADFPAERTMLDELQAIAALTTNSQSTADVVVEACRIIAGALGAEDAYVIGSGDPHYVRVGCECPPGEYEIKQKGYWLVWREVATHPEIVVGMFSVADRLAEPGRALVAGAPATHIVTVLPGDESNSEMLLVRGPWPNGLTAEQIAFFAVARPVVGQLVSNLLDAQRQKRQRDQLESLANVSKAFSEARESDNVLDEVCTALAKASGFDWVTMNVYDDGREHVVDTAMNRARHTATETATMFRDGRAMERVERVPREQRPREQLGVTLIRHGGGAFVRDVFDASHDDEHEMAAARLVIPGLRKYYERAHVMSVAMLPIVFQEHAIGDIGFTSSTMRAFDAGEVEFLKALTSQAATTIKGLRLYQALEESQAELRRSEERFRSLVQHASDLVTVIDADTTITYQSPSIEGLLRYQPEEVIGTRLLALLHADDAARWLAVLHEAMTDGRGVAVAEARMRHRDGSWRHVEFIGTDQFQNPAIGGFVLNIRDVTERTLLEEQLRHQALHDPLTKLANRTRFGDRLDHALARATREVRSVAVLFMDLDNFKGVNDSLGHAAGDELLTQVAERVEACLRPGDTVARLGGDEFAILLEDVLAPGDATTVTDRIFDTLYAPFAISGKELSVRASIGIALGGTDGIPADADALLRAADVAMYVAKSHGKGCYRVFEPSMQASMMQRLELLADLQRALERDEFVVHYQPMMFLQNGVLSGVEALVRWQHPERGLIPPIEFIGLAEESGVILGLGKWVMQQACARAAEWAVRYPGALSMSVNVSVKQLQSPGFVAEVAQVLRETALVPHLLILEITESVMMQDVPAMVRRLRELKELGVRLAIDDFGTGYSSLSYIRQFPFDLLKIDKSFIDDVGTAPNQKELTKAIIELGKTLNLELVAEGIEHGDQLSRLQTMDCELGQGFYFAKPMDGADIDALIAALAAGAAAAEDAA